MSGDTACPILMLNYDGWADTFAALESLGDERRHVWLIDNASPDDRTAEVARAFPEVRIVPMDRNWGWAGAYNRAIATAIDEGHRAVYIMNNDAIPQAGAIANAVVSLFSEPGIAAVGSLMLQHGGDLVFFDGEWHFHAPARRAEDAHRELRPVRSVHGGAFALKLDAFRDVGPFHEDYFLYHEETDWCLRAQGRGWTIAMNGQSRVYHEGGGSNVGFNTSYYMARNRYLAMQRGILLRDTAETRLSIAEYEMIGHHKSPLPVRVAVVNGLIDGWRGRFGQRTSFWPAMLTTPLAVVLPVLFRAKRKLRHVVGT